MAKVKTEWSPHLAYAVGLIATDGCLYKDRRHMSLTTKDYDLALTFQRCLGIKVKVGYKRSGFTGRKDCRNVQFGDVLFYRWLEAIGLSPNKSKSIAKLKVPDEYFFDFLRGCFDGDGSIYAYWDPRWKSSYMFYVQFASGSKRFLAWIAETVFRLSGVEGKIKPMQKSAYQLVYAKSSSVALCANMYHSRGVPALKRKLAKVKRIITLNEHHK